jgi:hypothetical protein
MKIRGRGISGGEAEGEVIFTTQPISFLGGVDPKSGVIIERGHELEGENIANKVFVFPCGKGSTVGSYVIYQLKLNGVSPIAMINEVTEPIVAVGAIISEIPVVDKLEKEVKWKNGMKVRVNGTEGYVEIL